jgi:hypothetical protein
MRRIIRRALVPIFAPLALACGRGDGHAGEARAQGVETRMPYRVTTVTEGGRLLGRLTMPDDSGVPAGDALARDTCGVRWPRSASERGGTRALVWITDLRAGKPLPTEKRYTLTIEHCQAAPRVQGALAGGTLNVLSLDPTDHRTRFLTADGATLDVIHQFDAGQLVPKTNLLGRPGLLELRCDIHPWTRAWIRVFDQPYFAEVEDDGRFTIDSIPPGEHELVIWHPVAGRREHRVTIPAGRDTTVELGF